MRVTLDEPRRTDYACQRCGTNFRAARHLEAKYCSVECSVSPPKPVLPPSIETPPVDTRSYLIGIFDGEGCITAGFHRTGSTYLIASVTMCSEPVVRLFKVHYNRGGITVRSKPTVGGLTLWTWQVTGASAIPILEDLVSTSLVKRDQAVLALQLARNMARYAINIASGFSPRSGSQLLTRSDREERTAIINTIRSRNGARNRFTTLVTDPLAIVQS
jgi:hypothetical protein